jgi:hypothetical protein
MEIANAYIYTHDKNHRDYFQLEEVPEFAGNFLVAMSFENLSTLPRQEFMVNPSNFCYNGEYGFASLVELSLFPDKSLIIHNNALFYLTEMVRLHVIRAYNDAINNRLKCDSSRKVKIPSRKLVIIETGKANDPYELRAPRFLRNM